MRPAIGRRRGRWLGAWLLALAVWPVGLARGADNVFVDLVVDATGYLVGDADDRFLVSGDFLNASEQSTSWATGSAELVFRGGGEHLFTIAGRDLGAREPGFADNFAWGALRLESGQSLVLQDANTTAGGAQYVRALILEDGVSQIAAITGNGLQLYYDPADPENAYLAAQTYALAAGGRIAPLVEAVPSITLPSALGLGLLITWAGVAGQKRPTRACKSA